MNKDYYIGLDMGTSSCGWAVTDTEYKLLRAKGKDMWGVRLFPEASSAAERRTFRVARRRRQRESARIGYLREFFAEEINKVDPGFYQRMDESKYLSEDKLENDHYILFNDKDFTDSDYNTLYPTIFHLRKELIKNTEKHDIRLIYLAILNMFKHRGHFLNANLTEGSIGNFKEYYDAMLEQLEELEIPTSFPRLETTKDLETVICSNDLSNSGKLEAILVLLGLSKKDKVESEIVKLFCGLKGTLSKIFVNETFDEETKKESVSFRDGNYEEKGLTIEQMLSEESFELFQGIKQMHDWGVLANIMQGETQSLSFARVKSYEKHNQDLRKLKYIYKTYLPKLYAPMFRKMGKSSYSAYVGSVNSYGEKERRTVKTSQEDLYKKIKADLANVPDCDEKNYVLKEIEIQAFLPKQLTSANGVIPNQLHKTELKLILANCEKHYPFLTERDESGLSISEKIVSLFEFQIPYYVGPLANVDGKGNGWAKRIADGPIMPWNFEQKIDVKASAEKFIDKMVNHCTYLNNETVLPKNSLLYERFMVLNELNNLKINGEPVSVELKQAIYNDLFTKGKKVTGKQLEKYLKINNYVDNSDDVELKGFDGNFAITLTNYRKFCEVFGVEELTYSQYQMAEQIIYWSTIYGDSKSFLRDKISEAYCDEIDAKQLKRICGYKFKDWGRLSKEFLQLEGADQETGEVLTIIERMWNENYNLMELLSNKFSYLKVIEEKTKKIEKTLSEIEYEDLEDLYISAPVKRMAWQTILILKEITQVMGCAPKRIFVEMARDANSDQGRTVSRKTRFKNLYKGCKDDGKNWLKEIEGTDEAKFRSKKLYLYYTQKGRCMYTGQIIDLGELFNDNLYDIDHIYPRHYTKDDSIENNLVLVRKQTNAHKSDSYPLEASIQQNQHSMWRMLRDGGFISNEKYTRLVRTHPFTDDELANFVNRQIVETRQGTKTIANLLEDTFPGTEVVYVKAGNVSSFRQKFDLLKCRVVNDFHHANDAYLNIVVGNTYYVKFTKNPYNFIKEYKKNPKANKYHMYRLFEFNVERNGELAWNTDKDYSINIVKNMMSKNTPLITRLSYEKKGGFTEQTIYKASDAKKAKGIGYLPTKASDNRVIDTTKYGGFSNISGTYFFLVEHTLKKKRVRTIEVMPLYKVNELDSLIKITEYCEKELKLIDPVIRYPKIKMYSLIKVNGFYMYITGRTGDRLRVLNAVPLELSKKEMNYIRVISKCYEHNNISEEMHDNGITNEENLELYDLFIEKHTSQIYSKRPNSIGTTLNKGRKKFEGLSLEDQVYVLLQILQISGNTNVGANLKKIGASPSSGISLTSKNITKSKEFKLIHRSITGLFEYEVDLLKV